MIYEDSLFFDKGYAILINNESSPLYYFFDYDERDYSINMEFQHFHHFYEIFISLDEKASHIIEGDYYALEKYDMVLLRPALLHKSVYPARKPRKRLIINFSVPPNITGLEQSISTVLSVFDGKMPIYRFPPPIRTQLFSPLNDIFILGKQRRPQYELIIHSKFQEFLWLLSTHRRNNLYKPRQPIDSITHKIYVITSYIHTNYQTPLSLDIIAERFFISPYYLSHQFKKITGFTMIHYIQMTRVQNAQQLLLYTEMKVKDITEQCGFTSFSQFNRVFKKFCYFSPLEYRKKRQEMQQINQNQTIY
ncbi:MAG: AraC family transcriptional regulator [Treponema sp.]|jgi:AraC-like DNA-binding protein|nr:AraC family transcriptional regulator [Treponema sp.]